MNKQRKVLITITYNEMGIIIDTKAEEVAQPVAKDINVPCTDTISRQAAIDGTKKIPDLSVYAYCSFLDMLSKLPSAQPVEDIHREKEQAYYSGYEDGAKVTRSGLTSVPERKKGEWMPEFDGNFKAGAHWFSCSKCKRIVPEVRNGGWNYCPNCGAKMYGKDES